MTLTPGRAAAEPVGPAARAAADDGDGGTSWATRRAADLTDEVHRLRAAGRDADALVRLREALTMDPTYTPAYLELAAAREAVGDLREAEQVLAMALERVPSSAAARQQRAALRARRGDRGGAARDLDASLAERPDDLALHARVTEAWIAAGQIPRALASARRWRDAAARSGDLDAELRARRTAAACAIVVDRADPVSWSEGRGAVRAAIARAARAEGRRVHRTSTDAPRPVR